jgi:FAD synthetase
MVGGVFDLLHPGHIYTLKAAKSLGDLLVVIVATTSTALKLKKNRKIYHDEKHRQELVSSLSFVDLALIGEEGTLYDTVSFVKPDIIALGYDQSHDEKEIQKNCLERGINLEVVRLTSPIPAIKSTQIKSELGTSFYDI